MHADTLAAAPVTAAPSGLARAVRNRWVRGAAALGVVIFGIFITLSIWAEPGSPVVVDSGNLVASGRLHQVLNDPSVGGREDGPSVGDRFTDKSGRSCRPFSQGAITGTACRVGNVWRVTEMRQR